MEIKAEDTRISVDDAMTNLLFLVPLLLLMPTSVLAQNQTNLYHIGHFHVATPVEKDAIKKHCFEGILYQAVITAETKHKLEINDTASVMAEGYGPIYTVDPQFLNDTASDLLNCTKVPITGISDNK